MQEVITIVTDVINNIGFPIAACLGMGWFIVDERKQREQAYEKQRFDFHEMLKATEESHGTALSGVVQSLNQNTAVLTEILTYFKKGE